MQTPLLKEQTINRKLFFLDGESNDLQKRGFG